MKMKPEAMKSIKQYTKLFGRLMDAAGKLSSFKACTLGMRWQTWQAKQNWK